ncbi:hypothetical protein EDD22DRAFT_775474, partial [Suillus occidentalis]
WVTEILSVSPCEKPLHTQHPVNLQWWGDASTSFGIGIVIGQHWAAWKWKEGFQVGPGCKHNIGWAKATAVELGLRLALHLGLSK